ncbi:MAG: hypothetical protein WDA12_04840 [Bacilli bacterium]
MRIYLGGIEREDFLELLGRDAGFWTGDVEGFAEREGYWEEIVGWELDALELDKEFGISS